MQELRIAIVGMGIGQANAGGFVRNARSRVVALCDLVEEKMVDFAANLPEPVQMYTSYEEMCRNPDIDAVFVGTPNQFHVPVALEVVRSGKHVMVTKPLADSVPAATELVAAAEAAGVVNMMSLSTRFAPAVQYLGQLTQAGEFGDLYYARGRSVRRSGIPSWSLGFVRKGGGAFRDMGVHVLDTAWWLLGKPKPVSVLGVAGAKFGPFGKGFWDFAEPSPEMVSEYASDDYAGGFIRFENDVGMQIESFWASHQPTNFGVELFGTDAGAQMWPLKIYRTVNGKPQTTEVDMVTGDRDDVAWDAVADHFVASILDGIECQAPLRHGLIVQGMMEALLESAETGREVRMAA